MPFVKGQSGNPGGRVRGSISQESRQLKLVVAEFTQNKVENLDELFDSLHPKEQMNFLIKLLDFVLPKPVDVPQVSDSPEGDFFEMARRNITEVGN